MTDQLNPSPLPVERSKAAVTVDDLVRRYLRVSDPRDPEAVSQALRERYADEQQALDQEAAGLPFFKVTRIDTRCPSDSSTSVEMRQAKEDVSRDLDALVGNALLKDIHPELRGWSQHIRQSVMDGINAARFALDPWQRDQAMATRRLLGDYARIARFVGALTPGMNSAYRSLARSLDEVAASILVTIGEAIAQAGYGGGRFLLQAPASELQARRDAVINALRNLMGSRYATLGQDEWAYGQHALRQVAKYLDEGGLTDLRALFQENHVARVLDELVHWTTRGSAEDLRALGATAHLTLGRFRRLILVSKNIPSPPAPPFAAYLDTIHSFLDAFSSGAGYRLLYLARPAIAHYGLYGAGGPDTGTRRMLNLTALRGVLAQALDCYMGCDCGSSQVRCQVLLDKLLFDLDRAIDLYAMGTDPEGNGAAEQRAAAYGVVVECFLEGFIGKKDGGALKKGCTVGQGKGSLKCNLEEIEKLLLYRTLSEYPGTALERMHQELCIQRDGEAEWESLLHTLAPGCFSWKSQVEPGCMVLPINDAKPSKQQGAADGAVDSGLLVPTQNLVECAVCKIAEYMKQVNLTDCGDLEVSIPETVGHGIAELSGARNLAAQRVDNVFAAPFTEYLAKRNTQDDIIEPHVRVSRGTGEVTWQVFVAVSDDKQKDQIGALLRDHFHLSDPTQLDSILRQPYTTLREGLSKEQAMQLVNSANKKLGFESFFASQALAREGDSICFTIASGAPQQYQGQGAGQTEQSPPEQFAEAYPNQPRDDE